MIKVWITMLTPAYAGMIVTELVDMGFSVKSLDQDLTIGEGPALLSLLLDEPDFEQGSGPSVSVAEFYREFIKEALDEKKIIFHSLIVMDEDDEHASTVGSPIERGPTATQLRLVYDGENDEKQDA